MALKTTLDGFYERESYMYGGGWVSYENGVRLGTVRVINGLLSKASLITGRIWPRKDRVLWSSVEQKELRTADFNERP